jgi:copper resistance protein D
LLAQGRSLRRCRTVSFLGDFFAAGGWLGGLLPLANVLALAHRSPSAVHCAEARDALQRFSGMGYTAVATLVGSGLINSWYLVGAFSALTASLYGQLLVTKLCLFGGMLTLAGLNRLWLVPSLMRETASQPAVLFVRLRRHVLGEQAIGLIIVVVVSLLGLLQPAIGS